MEYLFDTDGPSKPVALARKHIVGFVDWLKKRYPEGTSAATVYGHIRPLLEWMIDQRLIAAESSTLFPTHPFGVRRPKKAPQPMSQAEIKRLADALKTDLVAIHKGRFQGPDSEALTVAFLVVAMRTGINTTPLLEASRSCLEVNPLMPNTMLLRTFKRRGGGSQTQTLRTPKTTQTDVVVPMDGVGVLKGVLARTEALAAIAPEGFKDRIWLYRAKSRRTFGSLLVLDQERLNTCARQFSKRHGLRSDDGDALVPSVQRLRKTMEMKLWHLSDGDLIAVAAAVGHTPAVADRHYLSLTDEMKADAVRFVGLALPGVLRGEPADVEKTIPIHMLATIQRTPVGRCGDSVHGGFAPNNGVDHCSRFTDCLTCPTYVVVGSVQDLHRLFSFQAYMQAEIEYLTGSDMAAWREHRRNLIALIDDFTSTKFAASVVQEARSLSLVSPHPFWAARMQSLQRRQGDRTA
ncbi:hypothetical protein [Bordetella sp. 15P40C-2]|uniref:hypothetical protein n=1 Tax=Bordetella sp. 15P40C-2 TaxID=2572246 RepID=UPI001324456C|nr:hypothetical protein [Bordetella sp. 15P40C-2]MVW72776.1 hypothetical protein [Bordetella sp. 15P40C-2]